MTVRGKHDACLRRCWSHPVHWLAFMGGAGCAPKAPGTLGTLAAVPLYVLASPLPPLWFMTLIVFMFVAGIWICNIASRDLGVHDHPGIVWDEVVGYFVTMIAAPAGWVWWLIGFALFRLFDIWKPWPIHWLDSKLTGGFGIMIDDVLAGVFALGCLQFIAWQWPL